MRRSPTSSTRTVTLFPTRRSSDLRRLFLAVVVEALAGLSAEVTGHDHAPQQRHGREVGVAELGVQRVEYRHRRVEAHQVEQGQRPHREVAAARSEEQTSELQSLMRNSYAVFCFKKKQNKLT